MKTRLLLVALFLSACGGSNDSPPDSHLADTDNVAEPAAVADNSRNALDWPGSYHGLLPCADCEGIETTVVLEADGSYQRNLVYRGESAEPVQQSGRFSWNTEGSVVTLSLPDGGVQRYQVGENRLFHLDQAGDRIGGDLEPQYLLRKSIHDARIEDRRWALVEVAGQANAPDTGGRAAFLLLDSAASQASGNNSCNNFFGGYFIENGQRIRFAENLAVTMMACPDATTESAFMAALREVDNYSVTDREMTLNRARMAPLLRFEVADPGDPAQ